MVGPLHERHKMRLSQDEGSKTPVDGLTSMIPQRSEAKSEHAVTRGLAGLAGRLQARD